MFVGMFEIKFFIFGRAWVMVVKNFKISPIYIYIHDIYYMLYCTCINRNKLDIDNGNILYTRIDR